LRIILRAFTREERNPPERRSSEALLRICSLSDHRMFSDFRRKGTFFSTSSGGVGIRPFISHQVRRPYDENQKGRCSLSNPCFYQNLHCSLLNILRPQAGDKVGPKAIFPSSPGKGKPSPVPPFFDTAVQTIRSLNPDEGTCFYHCLSCVDPSLHSFLPPSNRGLFQPCTFPTRQALRTNPSRFDRSRTPRLNCLENGKGKWPFIRTLVTAPLPPKRCIGKSSFLKVPRWGLPTP